MRIRYKILTFLFVVFCSCNSAKHVNDKQGMYTNQAAALKDYAFCKCVEYGFMQDSISLNDISIPIIFELSDYSIPLNKRQKIDSLAKKIAQSITKQQVADYGNKRKILLDCLNFYRGKELEKLISKTY